MRAKKTMDVAEIKKFANKQLANPEINDAEKRGIITMIERILHDTGNYQGFQYNYWNKTGWQLWRMAGEPENTDPYLGNQLDRVYY